MRLLICGSRTITDFLHLYVALTLVEGPITSVVSGMARGPDRMGWAWARKNNLPVDEHPADWNTYGRSAGFRRNLEMLDVSDAVLALYDGTSKGTLHTLTEAKNRGLPVWVYTP